MTPIDEAHFIALWRQGLSHDAPSQALGILRGTVSSRAYTITRVRHRRDADRGL